MEYIKGLDGFRGLLVLGIVIFHTLTVFYPSNTSYFQGGFLAVESFFVLSGFLITKLLININLNYENPFFAFLVFFKRRFLRIFPALIFVILLIYALAYTLNIKYSIEKESVFGATFLYNFYLIFRELPYFQKFEEVNFFTHLWSLSIEFQLYLFTGLLFLVFSLTKVRFRWVQAVIFIFLSLVSLFLNYYYFNIENINPDKIYFSTEARSFGFFIGSVVAIFEEKIKDRFGEIIGYITGIASSIALLVSFFTMSVYTDWLYPFGFLIVDIITAVLIVSFLNSSFIRESFNILDWFGKRAYSVYLWHYPLFVIANLMYGSQPVIIILTILTTLSISDLTYRVIENPFRKLEFNIRIVPTVVSFMIFFTLLSGFYYLNKFDFSSTEAKETKTAGTIIKEDKIEEENQLSKNIVDSLNQETVDVKNSNTQEFIIKDLKKDYNVFMIGDSVLLGAANYIKKVIPTVKIDAKVGRQVVEVLNIIDRYREEIDSSDAVVIHIGSNGYARKEVFESIVEKIGKDKRIYFLTVNASVPWRDKVNENIRYLKKYSNVRVIEWDKISDPEIFVKDKVHLSSKGIVRYTNLIKSDLGLFVSSLPTKKDDIQLKSNTEDSRKIVSSEHTKTSSEKLPENQEKSASSDNTDSSDEILKTINEFH